MRRRTKNRILLFFLLLFFFLSGLLLGVYGERFFASGRVTDYGRDKYYANYIVQSGDTLFSIAGDLMPYNPEYQDVRQYVEEIRRLNRLSPDGNITPGDGLILPYYFDEGAPTQEEVYARYGIGILN